MAEDGDAEVSGAQPPPPHAARGAGGGLRPGSPQRALRGRRCPAARP